VGRIKDLWEKNRIYHEGIDPHFGHLYADLVFEIRMKPLLERPEETVLLTIATKGERAVGYCLSTREGDEAELVSMHVATDCRGGGIGKALVRVHLAWMRDHGCEHIGVTVAHANPETIAFYRSVGFLPNTLSMMQPINK
jgi:ribosomal protein S18 acetylase RimI-like enzyme